MATLFRNLSIVEQSINNIFRRLDFFDYRNSNNFESYFPEIILRILIIIKKLRLIRQIMPILFRHQINQIGVTAQESLINVSMDMNLVIWHIQGHTEASFT